MYVVGDEVGNMWNGQFGEQCNFSLKNWCIFKTKTRAESAILELSEKQDSDYAWKLSVWKIQRLED